MKIVLQRVKKAKCTVDGKITGAIERGYLLLVGYTHGDDPQKNQRAAKKIANLRVFEDENEKMNLDIKKVNGKILAISQFTLYANTNDEIDLPLSRPYIQYQQKNYIWISVRVKNLWFRSI